MLFKSSLSSLFVLLVIVQAAQSLSKDDVFLMFTNPTPHPGGTPTPKSESATPDSLFKNPKPHPGGTPTPKSESATPAPKSESATPAPKSESATPAPKSESATP